MGKKKAKKFVSLEELSEPQAPKVTPVTPQPTPPAQAEAAKPAPQQPSKQPLKQPPATPAQPAQAPKDPKPQPVSQPSEGPKKPQATAQSAPGRAPSQPKSAIPQSGWATSSSPSKRKAHIGTTTLLPKDGQPTILKTNMFQLNRTAVANISSKVKRYEITVIGKRGIIEKPSQNLVRGLVFALRRQDPFKKVIIFTDGSKICYSLQSLEPLVDDAAQKGIIQDIQELGIEDIDVKKSLEEKPRARRTDDGISVHVVEPTSKNLFRMVLRPAEWNPNDTLQTSQMLQVAIKYARFESNQAIVIRGRNMYDPTRFQEIGDDLVVFEGLFQSIRFNGNSEPILNVDLSYMVAMASNLSIFAWMMHIAKYYGRSFRDALNDRGFINYISANLRNMKAVASYGAHTSYVIEGLKDGATPENTKFEDKTGKQITIAEHVLKTYNKKVDPKGIVLLARQRPAKKPEAEEGGSSSKSKKKSSGGSRPTYLIAELFSFDIGQRRNEALSAQERTNMIDQTRKKPNERFKEINDQVPKLIETLKAQTFDIGINPTNIQVNARVLVPKQVIYRDPRPVFPRNGGWDHSRFFSTVQNPAKWALVHSNSLNVKEFFSKFQHTIQKLGLNLNRPDEINVSAGGSKKSFVDAIRERQKTGNYQLVVCFLPQRGAEAKLYEQIKLVTYVELGIASQCVIDESRKKKGEFWTKVTDTSVLENVAASINAKLDQDNCIVREEEMKNILGSINPNDVLVLGLDVFHGDTKNPEDHPSVVALCASRTRHFNRYTTSLRRQSARQELVVVEDKDPEKSASQKDTLSPMLEEVFAGRDQFPSTIIFYRDGVGEGMYDRVIDFEISKLRAKLAQMYAAKGKPAPHLTYIIVQKRHHFRSQCMDANSRDSNPPPGTYVDNLVIVDEEHDNFYLYSHKALAGTARPTHYQILTNEVGFSKDQLAHFTYALCHLHQGCTKTVSIPAPVYYADLACGLAGSCFRDKVEEINARLRQTLYMI